MGTDTASYKGAPTAVVVDLVDGSFFSHAAGDSYNSIENITGSSHNDALTGDGNENRIDGRHGEDIIRGLGGADTLLGGPGDDTIEGGRGGDDTLRGQHDDDDLSGGKGDDKIKGGKGSDRIDGGKGNDVLSGWKHFDQFAFSTKLNKNKNVDEITDFQLLFDTIGLHTDIFKKVGNNLDNGEFIKGKNAQDNNDCILYNKNNGKLFYDKDGKGGDDKVQFAVLKGDPNGLDASHFEVYG
ncbi:MAG: calcium-binding protein [Hyphomicrobiales bacterium]|nr:calcium-binding protein [Hyphomicrobiales bacterium]